MDISDIWELSPFGVKGVLQTITMVYTVLMETTSDYLALIKEADEAYAKVGHDDLMLFRHLTHLSDEAEVGHEFDVDDMFRRFRAFNFSFSDKFGILEHAFFAERECVQDFMGETIGHDLYCDDDDPRCNDHHTDYTPEQAAIMARLMNGE